MILCSHLRLPNFFFANLDCRKVNDKVPDVLMQFGELSSITAKFISNSGLCSKTTNHHNICTTF